MFPHLTTSLAGPLAQLERMILDQRLVADLEERFEVDAAGA